MSTTLFFLVPIGMLAVVWSLCFVGACLPVSGLPPDPYSNIVLAESSLLAYWPLNDAMGAAPPPPFPPPPQGSTSVGTAADFSGKGHTGSYLLPPSYPMSPPKGSALISGAPILNLQESSIVPGDVSNNTATDKLTNPASVDFEGGYVSISVEHAESAKAGPIYLGSLDHAGPGRNRVPVGGV
jgi:hypothetical protein